MLRHLVSGYRLLRLGWAVIRLSKVKYFLGSLPVVGIPAWLVDFPSRSPAVQILLGLLAIMLLLTAIGWLVEKQHPEFQSQRFSALFHEGKYVEMGAAAGAISGRNPEYNRDQVNHALLAAIWSGVFEDGFGNSFLFLPISHGSRYPEGGRVPIDSSRNIIARAPLYNITRRDLISQMRSSLPAFLPSTGDLKSMSDREMDENGYYDILASFKPSQYVSKINVLGVYFEKLLVPRKMFVGWFFRWKEGKYVTR